MILCFRVKRRDRGYLNWIGESRRDSVRPNPLRSFKRYRGGQRALRVVGTNLRLPVSSLIDSVG